MTLIEIYFFANFNQYKKLSDTHIDILGFFVKYFYCAVNIEAICIWSFVMYNVCFFLATSCSPWVVHWKYIGWDKGKMILVD